MNTKRSFSHVMSLPWVMCGLAAIYYCYEYFLRISPSVMTPELMRAYKLDGAGVGNLSAFYYHAYVPMQIVVGLLMDRYGPRRLLTVACLLCAIGIYLFACCTQLGIAQIGRFMVGFGSAFAFVGAIKLATIWLPPNRFALLSGIIMCLGMIGAMTGDFLLRTMVDAIGWKTACYGSAFFGAILSVILWSFIRDRNPANTLLHHEILSFKVLLINLWVILKNHQIWLNGIVGLLLNLVLALFAELWGISYLEQAQGLSRVVAAGANSMVFLGWAIGAPFWGWFSDRIEQRRKPIIGAGFMAIIFTCALLYTPNLPAVVIYSLLFGMGFMCSSQILTFAIAHEISSLKITATAIALTNMLVMLGGSIFQPLTGHLLDLFWTGMLNDGAHVYSVTAYHVALSILPFCFLLAIIMTYFLRETHCQPIENHSVKMH